MRVAASLRSLGVIAALIAGLALVGCVGDSATQSNVAVEGVFADVPPGPRTSPPGDCHRTLCPAALPSSGTAVALGDIDGDGDVDIALAEPGPQYRIAGPLRVFRNVGAMRFEEATAGVGLGDVRAWALTFGDLDNDGDEDLAISGRRATEAVVEQGRVMVFENRAGRFLERRGAIPSGGEGVALSLHLADFNDDGLLDLVAGQSGTDVERDYFDRVLVSEGSWVWREGEAPHVQGFTWVAMPTDLDGDGHADLLIGNDAAGVTESPPALYMQQGTCDPSLVFRYYRHVSWWLSGAALRRISADGAVRWEPLRIAPSFNDAEHTPMGFGQTDLNADRRWDYYATNVTFPSMYLSGDGGVYTQSAQALGLRPWRDSVRDQFAVLWSALFHDIDRDGDEDLFLTLGTLPASRIAMPNAFQRNEGMSFAPSSADDLGFALPGSWSGLAGADLDGDGDRDLVMTPQSLLLGVCEPHDRQATVFRNDADTSGNHWMRVRLVGTVSNRDGLGARVEVPWRSTFVAREITHGGGTMSSGEAVAELGLGDVASVAEIRVRWPDGSTQVVPNPPIDREVTVTQPRWLSTDPPRGNAAAVEVRVERESAAEYALIGAGRWERPIAATSATTWTGRLTGHGRVGLVVTVPGTTVRAARWFTFP